MTQGATLTTAIAMVEAAVLRLQVTEAKITQSIAFSLGLMGFRIEPGWQAVTVPSQTTSTRSSSGTRSASLGVGWRSVPSHLHTVYAPDFS
jgi:hypothetical protein